MYSVTLLTWIQFSIESIFPQRNYLSRIARISLLTRNTCQKHRPLHIRNSRWKENITGINSPTSHMKFQPSYTKVH